MRKPIGRPRKFKGPSRVVTITLPEQTLADLFRIDDDRARAIVRATAMAIPEPDISEPLVRVIEVGRDIGMITVPWCEALLEIADLSLVQITPTRYLIVISSGRPLSEIERAMVDRIGSLDPGRAVERGVLTDLLGHLRRFRRTERVDTAEVILVRLSA